MRDTLIELNGVKELLRVIENETVMRERDVVFVNLTEIIAKEDLLAVSVPYAVWTGQMSYTEIENDFRYSDACELWRLVAIRAMLHMSNAREERAKSRMHQIRGNGSEMIGPLS